jgi:hypothetical protein
MVAFGDDNKTVSVPGLILENQKQARRFHKALLRKELKTKYKNEEGLLVSIDTIEEYTTALQGERCRLDLQE